MSSAQPIRMTRRGPGLDRLLGAVAEGIDQGLVPVELFNDEDVFRAEMERIFALVNNRRRPEDVRRAYRVLQAMFGKAAAS